MIKVFSVDGCKYCDILKGKLRDANMDFTEIEVGGEEPNEEFNAIFQATQVDSVPIVIVNKTILVPEKSFKTIDEAFDIILKLTE